MKRIMVRYKVKSDRVAENEALIAKVFEQLQREKPQGLRSRSVSAQSGKLWTPTGGDAKDRGTRCSITAGAWR